MKKLFSFSVVLFLFIQLTGQTNFSWNFGTASPGSATPSGSLTNLTVGDVSIGNTLGTLTMLTTTSPSSTYTGYSASYNAGNAARTGVINTGASGSAYFEFTLTPATGYSISFSAISFGTRSTSTGPQAYALRSSLDGYVGDIATGTMSANSTWALKSNSAISFSGTSGTAITFRLYGYNGAGSPGANNANWRIDDLTITVDVSGGSGSTAPTLTADATNNNVDNNIDITFTDDATWRAAVTGVTVNGSSLTASDYTLTAGNLQLKPSAGNALLTVSGSKNIAVAATGYSAATVTQVIDAGAAAKLLMQTQPVGPATNGGLLATQPKVNVADQFGNIVASSTATITAAAGSSPVWTIGGTTSVAAVAGTATYTDITASGSGVVGATIVFSSTGLTDVTSAGFNTPCESATLPYAEDFSYVSGSLLTNNCWVAHSGTGTNNLTVASATPISYSGYPSGGGNYVAMANTGQDINKGFTSQNSGSLYVAFLVNPSAVQTTGDYFAHFTEGNGATPGTTFLGRVYAKSDGAGGVKFGVSKYTDAALYSTSSYALSTTHLIVLKYTFNTGTTNDSVALFINPSISSTEPTATLHVNAAGTDAVALSGFCLRQGNASNAATLSLDGIRLATTWADIMGVVANTPVIQATPSSLAGFSTSAGTVSAIQTCHVSGDYLQDDVLVTAPTNYEVSTDSINFYPTVTLSQAGGDLTGEPVKVFVRITSSSAEGTVTGNLVLSSLNALNANIAVSGFVYKPEPTNHALNLQAASTVWSSINVTWNDNAGTIPSDGFLLVINNTGTFTLPTDGVPVTNDLVVSDGSGAVNVASGVQTYTWNGLSSSTHYYFEIYPYTNSGTYIDYKTSLTIPSTDATTAAFLPPTVAWTFDSTTNGTATPLVYVANYGTQANTATLYADGTNGSSVWTAGNEIDAFTGTVINDPKETTYAGSSLALIGGTALSANGKSIIFKFSMTNLIDPIITFATRGTSTGFNTHTWEWSTDNVTYTAFGTNTANTTTSFLSRTLDMSAIDQVDQAATVYLKLTVSGASNATGNNRIDNFVVHATTQLQNKTLNLKAFIEGLYNSGTGEMNPANDDTFTPKWGATIADTITIKMHDATTFNEIEKFAGINWNTNGTIQITTIPTAYNGNYYISIFPKNGVPVTTSTPISFAGSIISYDFSTAQTQAYGSDAMKEVESGVFALYSGELDHDMFYFIDLSDLPYEEADVELGSIGYIITDIDGNGWVDLSDLAFIEANMINGPYFQNPLLKKRPMHNK